MIERTFDYRKVKKAATWPPIISSEIIYLLDDDKDLWAFHEHLDGMMVHAQMSVNRRGVDARESAKRAFAWIFKNTNAKTIYAVIPKKVKPACHMAIMAGMEFIKELNNKRYYEVKHGIC